MQQQGGACATVLPCLWHALACQSAAQGAPFLCPNGPHLKKYSLSRSGVTTSNTTTSPSSKPCAPSKHSGRVCGRVARKQAHRGFNVTDYVRPNGRWRAALLALLMMLLLQSNAVSMAVVMMLCCKAMPDECCACCQRLRGHTCRLGMRFPQAQLRSLAFEFGTTLSNPHAAVLCLRVQKAPHKTGASSHGVR